MTSLQLLMYFSVIICGIGIVRKVLKYVRMPIHLRWELYPVAHEGKDYGGSYYEEVEWWAQSRKRSFIDELKFMIPEILFIRALYNHNRKLWIASFPFHGGLYVTICFLGLLVIGAVIQTFGVPVLPNSSSWFMRLLYSVTMVVGPVGFITSLVGCILLLFLRFADRDLKINSTLQDYFNLLFITALLICALAAWFYIDSSFTLAREYIQSLITVKPFSSKSAMLKAEIIIFALFLIYFPFTHMTHMFTKYFTYHNVRWEDEPNIQGGKIDTRVKSALQHTIKWNASHIPTGKKWSEIFKESSE
jgi:nitrate reductase gamma subunit